jgi:hypothetical protein
VVAEGEPEPEEGEEQPARVRTGVPLEHPQHYHRDEQGLEPVDFECGRLLPQLEPVGPEQGGEQAGDARRFRAGDTIPNPRADSGHVPGIGVARRDMTEICGRFRIVSQAETPRELRHDEVHHDARTGRGQRRHQVQAERERQDRNEPGYTRDEAKQGIPGRVRDAERLRDEHQFGRVHPEHVAASSRDIKRERQHAGQDRESVPFERLSRHARIVGRAGRQSSRGRGRALSARGPSASPDRADVRGPALADLAPLQGRLRAALSLGPRLKGTKSNPKSSLRSYSESYRESCGKSYLKSVSESIRNSIRNSSRQSC